MIVTEHKSFNAKANGKGGYIGTGNVSSDVQRSSYIRGHLNTHCNGHSFPEGQLQNTDLQKFTSLVSKRAIRMVQETLNGTESGIFYVFFHYSRRQRVIHGWLLTTATGKHLISQHTGPTYLSFDVLEKATELVTKPQSAHEILANMAK